MDLDGGGKNGGSTTPPFEVDGKYSPSLNLIQGHMVVKPTEFVQPEEVYEQGKPSDLDTAAAERSQDKASRLPRWSSHEALVLMEAKQIAEFTLKKNREARKKLGHDDKGRDGSFKGKWIIETKWPLISIFCKQRGVDREANQCRKRWGNMFGDYKRIKEWQQLSGQESFWVMRNDVRKENKLPSSFDPLVFDAMEKLMGRKPGSLPEAVLENGRPVSEEILFSEIEHPVKEEDAAACLAVRVGSSTPAPDACQGKPSTHLLGWKKRKQPLVIVPDKQKDPLVPLLERSCTLLASNLKTQNHMIQQDRAERKEQFNNLLSVLGNITDTLVKIAERL